MSAAVEVSTALAKVSWQDPQTGETRELILQEGARASIGRLESNDICIREQHVSRQHAFIEYQDGVFFVSDNASANGVFVNDERITEPFPLIAGDVIRLFVPLLQFKAVIGGETVASGEHLSTAHGAVGRGRLIMMGGPQEGTAIPLRWQSLRVGRATANAEWEVCIPDPSISRPHARMEFVDDNWIVYDLGSSNGTMVNNTPVNEKGRMLRDGDMVTFGMSTLLFRNA